MADVIWCLGGGGIKGAFQVGAALAVLRGFPDYLPTRLAGSSVGAINTLAFAAYPPDEAVAVLLEEYLGLDARTDMYEITEPIATLLATNAPPEANEAMHRIFPYQPNRTGVAGRVVGQYGLIFIGMFRGSGQFSVDYAPLAEALLTKAQELEPANPQWSTDLEQFRKLRAGAGLAR